MHPILVPSICSSTTRLVILSSLNLVKFLKEDGSFDIEGYRKACRVFIVAQEILVDLSSYPTEQIAKNSHDYRPLGLGYANLGTF